MCKLHEALAHLLCDPYLFDLGEIQLLKAEAYYLANLEILGKDLHRKFLIKKQAFYKKYGFFYDALTILNNLETELTAELSD